MRREGYHDYMGRRLREEGLARAVREESKPISRDDMWKKEIAEMQKQVHLLQMKVVNLNYIVDALEPLTSHSLRRICIESPVRCLRVQ